MDGSKHRLWSNYGEGMGGQKKTSPFELYCTVDVWVKVSDNLADGYGLDLVVGPQPVFLPLVEPAPSSPGLLH